MITLDHPRLVKLLEEKDLLVSEGRKITRDIENVEMKVKKYENEEKSITAKIKPDPTIEERGNRLVNEINERTRELEKLGKEIEQKKLEAVPEEIKKSHLSLLDQKEKLERDRNKIALKIQKIKDKVIPIIQKECKDKLINEFDDIETAKVKGGKIVITTFNHLEDWKAKFRKR